MKVKELFEISQVNIKIDNKEIEHGSIPVKYQYKNIDFHGDYNCSSCYALTSLEGSPKTVSYDFNCCYCHGLTSLEGAPTEVSLRFECYNCDNLESLKGSPTIVRGLFDCSGCNNLTTLEGAPDVVLKYFDCHSCKSLTSLEGIGVRYLKQINGNISLVNCPIKSHMLGLLKVNNLKKVELTGTVWGTKFNTTLIPTLIEVEEIINKHLKSGRRLSKCKQELIEAGLNEYAKL